MSKKFISSFPKKVRVVATKAPNNTVFLLENRWGLWEVYYKLGSQLVHVGDIGLSSKKHCRMLLKLLKRLRKRQFYAIGFGRSPAHKVKVKDFEEALAKWEQEDQEDTASNPLPSLPQWLEPFVTQALESTWLERKDEMLWWLEEHGKDPTRNAKFLKEWIYPTFEHYLMFFYSELNDEQIEYIERNWSKLKQYARRWLRSKIGTVSNPLTRKQARAMLYIGAGILTLAIIGGGYMFRDEIGKFIKWGRWSWYKELYRRMRAHGLSEKQALMLLAKHHQEQGGNLWSRKHLALFGIKASESWVNKHKGDPNYRIACGKTFEIIRGKRKDITDCFRAYANLDTAIEDTIEFFKSLYPGLYKALMDEDPDAFGRNLVRDEVSGRRYMTDPGAYYHYKSCWNYIWQRRDKLQ